MKFSSSSNKLNSIKKYIDLFPPPLTSCFVTEDHVDSYTLCQFFLQLGYGCCCLPMSRAVLFFLSFFKIHLAVRQSVIRQNEDFPHNQTHAKSDIIQSGPFSSAFVLCFLLLFWTFLWFQRRLKNLK